MRRTDWDEWETRRGALEVERARAKERHADLVEELYDSFAEFIEPCACIGCLTRLSPCKRQ